MIVTYYMNDPTPEADVTQSAGEKMDHCWSSWNCRNKHCRMICFTLQIIFALMTPTCRENTNNQNGKLSSNYSLSCTSIDYTQDNGSISEVWEVSKYAFVPFSRLENFLLTADVHSNTTNWTWRAFQVDTYTHKMSGFRWNLMVYHKHWHCYARKLPVLKTEQSKKNLQHRHWITCAHDIVCWSKYLQ